MNRVRLAHRFCSSLFNVKSNVTFFSTSSALNSSVSEEIDLVSGLTKDQQQLRATVREFVEKE